MDRLQLSLAAAPLVFGVCALATRAPLRRALAALAGGVAFAAGNLVCDLVAFAAGWWSYPGLADGGSAPLHWYAAAGLSAAGVSLLGWRARRRFGARGLVGFLVLFAFYGALRDWRVAHAPLAVIAFGPGALPWLADAAAWLVLMALALALQLRLGGDPNEIRYHASHAPAPNLAMRASDPYENLEAAATSEGVPVAPSLGPLLDRMRVPVERTLLDRRVVFVCVLSVGLALVAGLVAQLLFAVIQLVTNAAFFGRLSVEPASPAANQLGWLVLLVPPLGGVVVGLMARFGSKAIRGHGIPEAMERVLVGESRIPARVTFLKPLSAAISIGTGGPFGAEGPIIATGGALGSLLGQVVQTTAVERKTLLAAGAAAGMAATFGSPVSAVLLAIELLLFELRPRSIVAVALAAATATAVRTAFVGYTPAFAMPALERPGEAALAAYVILGASVGCLSVYVTRSVYWIEDLFERLPVHWMWWPALGGVVVGAVGLVAPRTLGVGYTNIEDLLSGHLIGAAALLLCALKFVSWSIALGSGTSGGTLAPLFTIGGAAGVVLGGAVTSLFPALGLDLRICALVGMAAMFAGASRALLTSVVFAFETTLQPLGLLPLLGGCAAGYLVSALLMRNTIMTEKLARRGVRVPAEYSADFLDLVEVADACSRSVVSVAASDSIAVLRGQTVSHQGFPVVDAEGLLVGVVTRRDFLDPSKAADTAAGALVTRAPVVIYADSSLREAADQMVREDVGRLPVVERGNPRRVIGFLTRSDLLRAHERRLAEARLGR